jgi:hypothetical protein
MFDKALVRLLRNIRAYLSIFDYILKNIQKIYWLRLIANRQNRLSVRPSRPYTAGLLHCLSSMTTLLQTTSIFILYQQDFLRSVKPLLMHGRHCKSPKRYYAFQNHFIYGSWNFWYKPEATKLLLMRSCKPLENVSYMGVARTWSSRLSSFHLACSENEIMKILMKLKCDSLNAFP